MKHWITTIVLLSAAITSKSAAQQDSLIASARQPFIHAGTLVRVDNGHGWRDGKLARSFSRLRSDTVALRVCNMCAIEQYPARTLVAAQVGTGASRGMHVGEGIVIGAVAGVALGVRFNRSFLYEGGNAGLGGVVGGLAGVLGGAAIGAALPPSLR